MMDNSYCLKCKRKTKNINSKGFVTINKKYLVKSLCDICKSEKTKFVSKQDASGFAYNIYANKFYYLKIEEKFVFNKIENFKYI